MIEMDISKSLHGSLGALQLDVKLSIKEYDFVLLSGASGAGKTTLLRILAGLEEAQGLIKIGDEVWLDGKKSRPVQKRKLGFVFQEYALFPHMTVEENLLFVADDKTLASELLAITELDGLRHKMPRSLSGGQQQRVSLCRAFMQKPRILLLDEPLSALDVKMRLKLQDAVRKLHDRFETTTIMISHDPSEITRLADRVLILNQGKIIQDSQKIQHTQQTSFSAVIVDTIKGEGLLIMIDGKLVLMPVDVQVLEGVKIGDSIEVLPSL